MDKILELRQKRAKIWEDAKAFIDSHEDDDGNLSAEDAQTYDAMESDIVNISSRLSRIERQEALDRELSQPVNAPITHKPEHMNTDEKTGKASREYASSFWNAMRSAEVLPSVRNALQIGTDSEGGYLVPDEFENTLIEALTEENTFRALATVIKTSNGDRKIPLVSATGEASWIEEEGLITDSDDAFGQLSLGAHKLATMIKVSEELLNDSAFNLESFISRQFAKRIGSKEEAAFISGNGSSKPTGILHTTGGAQTGVTTAGTAPTADEIIDLYYSLKKPYRKNAVWLMNDSTVKVIRKLKDSTGNYLWQPSLVGGTPDKILDCRLVTSPSMPAIEAGTKAVAFGDLSYYWIADRQNRIFKRLNELYAANGQIGFMATQRVDGRLTLPEAVKVLLMKS